MWDDETSEREKLNSCAHAWDSEYDGRFYVNKKEYRNIIKTLEGFLLWSYEVWVDRKRGCPVYRIKKEYGDESYVYIMRPDGDELYRILSWDEEDNIVLEDTPTWREDRKGRWWNVNAFKEKNWM